MTRRNHEAILSEIRSQGRRGDIRVTQHAHQEMVEEGIVLDEVLECIERAVILEDYPEHRRGACCLLSGQSAKDRAIHIVLHHKSSRANHHYSV